MFLPTATTYAYVKWYPIPAKWFYEKTKITHKELLEVRQEIEDLTPMPQEEANEIRRELAEIRNRYGKELKDKDDQIEVLNSTIAEHDAKVNDLNRDLKQSKRNEKKEPVKSKLTDAAYSASNIDLSEKQREILKFLSLKVGAPLTEESLADSFQGERPANPTCRNS
jgi:septal ring factor EnvC (AmiA/AmiB activator)